MLDREGLMGEAGTIREARGASPLLLDRADKAWVVEGGHADIFTARLEAGRPAGARRPFFSAAEGDILLGATPPQGRGRAMLAVCPYGAALRELDVAAFLELGLDPAKADDVQRLLRRWIRNASLAVGRREVLPRDSRDLSGSGRLPVGRGGNVHPSFKTVWVRLESGRASFMGRPDFPPLPANKPFPLVRGTWLSSAEGAVLSFAEEWPPISWGRLESVLDLFRAFVLECEAANARASEAAEAARMEEREEARRSMLRRGLARLAAIAGPRGLGEDLEADPERPLLAACRAVGRAAGIEVREAWNGMPRRGAPESLDDIARASGFRTRQVALKGDWWRRDNGPLLVFRAEDRAPLAALPLPRGRYRLLDPRDGSSSAATAEAAEALDASAQVFYRPFPAERLGGRDLLRFGLRGRSRDIAAAALAGLAGALLGLVPPWMTGRLFDAVIPGGQRWQLAQLAALLAVVALSTLLFDLSRGIALLRVESAMDGSAQAALWDRLLSLPVPFFSAYTAGDLAERSMGICAIRLALSNAVVGAVVAGLFSLANFWLIARYDRGLAGLSAALFALGLAFYACASLALVRSQRRVVELKGRNQGIVLQLLTGIAKLRVSGAENGAFSAWAESYAAMKRHAFRSGELQAGIATFGSVYPVAASIAVFGWLIGAPSARLSAGGFLACLSAFLAIQNALLQAGSAIVSSIGIVPVFERLRPILDTLPETDEAKEKPGALSGRIEVNHLSYRYRPDGPLVLKDLSLSVEPGEFVAVVGGSGSGKSTLLRLLLGFDRPESGGVYYDGQDLASLDALAVRRQVGVVLQNGQLPGGDIASAILGSSKLGVEAAWEAARMVGLEKDIKEMPMGMFTVIPAGGGTLSGGQRQRLLIARAIVRKPRMLFFDEATSALDNKTQAVVGQSLESLQVSSVVIAHRLSTIVNADRIYVLEGGSVAEEGSYRELLERGGPFSRLAKRQSA